MAERTCDVEDCDKPHRARGLCSMHWKREHGTRTRYTITCETCGVEHQSARPDGRFCSSLCRDLWRVDQPSDSMWRLGERSRASRGYVQRVCPLPDDHPVRMICPLATKWCKGCGQEFHCRPSRRAYCTSTCANRAKRLARGRRHLRRREDIFERDAYTCWICDGPTSNTYRTDDIWSPTIDHLTPVSLGGMDDLDNLATAHMWCNSVRGNSLDISPAA